MLEWLMNLTIRGKIRRVKTGIQKAADRVKHIPSHRRYRRSERIPLPSASLMYKVGNSYNPGWFLIGGKNTDQAVRNILQDNKLALAGFERILDFGCGVGRVMRHWSDLEQVEIHGCDYNPALIEWDKRHMPFGTFTTNGATKKLPYKNGWFDFVWSCSVFTHLSEQQQYFWIEELRRVTEPGGYLMFTTHGEYFAETLSSPQREAFDKGQFVILNQSLAGKNACGAFHPEQFVRKRLARGWQVVDFVPEGASITLKSQDVWLLRKPGSQSLKHKNKY